MIRELKEKYRPLSNFWSCFIQFEGDMYSSVENAYQAAKMKHPEDRRRFFFCKASEAKQLGKLLPMRDDWEDFITDTEVSPNGDKVQVRISVMYQLVKQKFTNDEYLKQLLLDTSNVPIEEGNWWGDTFWGTVNGKGENWLGRILMKIRTELRNASNT